MNKNYITLTEAATLLPKKNGKRVAASTIWRWSRKGIGGVKLQTWRLGRAFLTTPTALEEFGRALAELPPSPSRPATPTAAKPRSQNQRARDIAAAKAELVQRGVLQ